MPRKGEGFARVFSPDTLKNYLNGESPSHEEVEGLLRKRSFDLPSLAILMRAFEDETSRKKIITETFRRRAETWGQQLFLMPPLYISDGDPEHGGCRDHCLYCPWRNGNVPKKDLVRLTPSEVQENTEYLMRLGYRDVELVAATDPELLKAESAAEMIRAAKNAGAENVGINFFPFGHSGDYKKLKEAGCTFVIVWQETYDPDAYRRFHPHGPKAHMHYRLDAHDRALQGGIKIVGVGFLGGLDDWRFEALATIAHAQYLRDMYGANIIFGMPRWKNSSEAPMNIQAAEYSDEQYEFVGALYSLAMPEALPWFSTREDFDLSGRSAQGGGSLFTLDCSTEVGGYTRGKGYAQFPVHSRPLQSGITWLQHLGLKPRLELPWPAK